MSARRWVVLLLAVLVGVASGGAFSETRIGFIVKSKETVGTRNEAALAFAKMRAVAPTDAVSVISWRQEGGWLGENGELCAPEEFDVVWYHQGDDANAGIGGAASRDLHLFVKGGGTLLLSGAAGRTLNDMTVEPTPLRVLGVSPDAFASALVVPEKYRDHPVFAGFDTGHPIVLTGFGGNALADFYGTAGPHGRLLADGNAGVGERPVVEYQVGLGRIIFVGWRLPDFTTATDAHRPNLERFFSNVLDYLVLNGKTHARLTVPSGPVSYVRILGLPFLKSEKPLDTECKTLGMKWVVLLTKEPGPGADFAAEGFHLCEMPVVGDSMHVNALAASAVAVTFFAQEKPVSQLAASLHAEQDAMDKKDSELLNGFKVVKPEISFAKGPLTPQTVPDTDQSILLGRSAFMAPGDGLGDCKPYYEPIEDGGFRITGSTRQLNRPIVHGQNRVWTGDVPMFRMDTITGNGSYSQDRFFPLWPRPNAQSGGVYPSMGTLRLAITGDDGKPVWLDTLRCTATFRPGYSEYAIEGPPGVGIISVIVAPTLSFHGMVCRVQCDTPILLTWQYGGVYWDVAEKNANQVEVGGASATITEANLPNNVVKVGWTGTGEGHTHPQPYGQQVEFTAKTPEKVYHVFAVWGVTSCDAKLAEDILNRLDTHVTAGWGSRGAHLKKEWFDAFISPALEPDRNFGELAKTFDASLDTTKQWWDRRRLEFQVHTPDPYLNALINWSRCTTEYHRKGPGLILGVQYWDMYSHISTGWYGKEWGGDHAAMEDNLRLYGAMQAEDGFIRWISPSLSAFNAENNTPYWVDQVWRHYTWTGDKVFLEELWPAVRKAVAWQRKHHDPDGDGLFMDFYEYWNCDSNGKGPKSAAPSAMSWRMLECAANTAAVVGDGAAEAECRALAAKTKDAVFRELWKEDQGRLGSIGAEGIWRGHPQTWEEYLAINAGLLSAEQGRSAMRWIESHYGFCPSPDGPQPGVHLLTCSDWWPIRWSTQWVPTGDTCLAVLGGLKSGDVAVWWPYLKTAVMSCFHSDFPGINMGIANTGAGGGDREDVDSVDPYTHVTVRGLFGIEPALHENRIDICPAFPSDWTAASIRTPDIAYDYHRSGNDAVFTIHTARALVKHVRANLTGPEFVTPEEKDSTVTVSLGTKPDPPDPPKTKPLLVTQVDAQKEPPEKIGADDAKRMVFLDLQHACNVTAEEMVSQPFIFDYAEGTETASVLNWWGNPSFTMPLGPRVVEAPNGVRFLTSGRAVAGLANEAKDFVALSGWRPYPLPAGATISVGMSCNSLWFLLQSYVHPMKNYIVNGEIVLHYAGDKQRAIALVPPYNLDCYFQHFSREGIPVPFGQISGGGFIHEAMSLAHADALHVLCDPDAVLESVEIRATCSEGIIAIAAITAIE